MNENWTRWIWASIAKELSTVLTPFHTEDEESHHDVDFYELRMDGPQYRETTKNSWQVVVNLSILVQVIKNPGDGHKIYRMAGLAASSLNRAFIIKRFGDGLSDDQSTLGCLSLKQEDGDIVTAQYGQVDPAARIMQATVDALYHMSLDV